MLPRYISLAVFLLLVTAAAALGSQFVAGEWYYERVVLPAWSPAPWFFGPAWALVYMLMAVAAWQVWETGHFNRPRALAWWLALLALLAAWSYLFFGLHRPGWAWLELTLALAVAVQCFRAFRPLSAQGAYLMLPGIAWLMFFWLLNFFTWNLSGGPLHRLLA